MGTYKRKRVSASVRGHLLMTIVHGRLHMNRDLLYKLVVTCVSILWHSAAFLGVVIGGLGIGIALLVTFVIESGSLGWYFLCGLEVSFWIAHTVCNKCYPEAARRYEPRIFHGHTAP